MLFGKGNRLLSFGYYALNKNEGITYGSLKIARKKTFFNGSRDFSLVWKFLGLFLRVLQNLPFSYKNSVAVFTFSNVFQTFFYLPILHSKVFPLKVADLEK